MPPKLPQNKIAIIVDIPQTADTSIILISKDGSDKSFSVDGVPNGSMYVDIMNVIYDKQWLGRSGITLPTNI